MTFKYKSNLLLVLVLAVLVGSGCGSVEQKSYLFRFVQISDLQPPMGSPAWQEVSETLDEVNRLHPAFVLIAGDITHSGTEPELIKMKGLLKKIKAPIHIVPGNHDTLWPATESEKALSPEELRKQRLEKFRRYFGSEQWAIQRGPIQILGLDSTAGWPDVLDQNQSWLKANISSDPKTTVFLMWHYPLMIFKTNAPQLVSAFQSLGIRGIMHGHIHQVKATEDPGSGFVFFSSGCSLGPTRGVMYFDVYDESMVCFWKPVNGPVKPLGVFPFKKPQ